MNDRFKFRAWQKNARKDEKGVHGIMREVCVVNLEGFDYALRGIKYNNGNSEYNSENYVLMQCTGLKDKNGKLIYEGDIVELSGNIYSVGYQDASFGLQKSNEDKRGNLYHWYNFCKPTHEPFIPEIIGNIYENPELLIKESL